jgi:hypothetical protein
MMAQKWSDTTIKRAIVGFFYVNIGIGILTFAVFYWGFDQGTLGFLFATTHPLTRMFVFFMGVCSGLVMLQSPTNDPQGMSQT